MKRRSLFRIICISFLMAAGAVQIPALGGIFASAHGKVLTQSGKPLPGVKIILIFSEDGERLETTTDKK